MEYQEYLEKWRNLFSNLPKYRDEDICYAWFTTINERDFGEEDIEITVEFTPRLEFLEVSRCKLMAYLKEDGTARFELGSFVQNYDEFSDLLKFTGDWKDIYLAILKLLKEGWPEVIFPIDSEFPSEIP